MSSNHCWVQLISIFINFLAVIGTILVIITNLSHRYDFPKLIPEIIENGSAEVDSYYQTPITPASWIHVTWLVVFGWMLVWSIHTVVSVFRTFAGVPVYVSPPLATTPVLFFSIGICAMTVTWFCVYDREYISTATMFSVCVMSFAWCAYALSLHSLHIGLYRLEKGEREFEAWLHRILVQNGLAFLGMWALFVAALNLCTSLVYNEDIRMDEDTAVVISLSVVAFFLILYVILDVTVLDRFTRYTCVQYLIPIVVLCACIFRQDGWPNDDVAFILLATLMAFSFLAIMLKAGCVACRVMTEYTEEGEGDFAKGDHSMMISSASSIGYLHEGNYYPRN